MQAKRRVVEALPRLGWSEADLKARRKGEPGKSSSVGSYCGVRSIRYTAKLRRLLPRPFRRGEGRGEGLLSVVYPAVLAVHSRTTMPRAGIAERLTMGTRGHLAWRLQHQDQNRLAAPADQCRLRL